MIYVILDLEGNNSDKYKKFFEQIKTINNLHVTKTVTSLIKILGLD